MKKIIVLLFICLFATVTQAFADDIIVLRNGNIINGIVTEISKTEVKYKKASNPDGPIYTIDKAEVLSIKYANGEIDKFEQSNKENNIHSNNLDSSNSPSSNTPVKATPAANNQNELANYAALPRLNLKPTNKESKDFFPIMAFTDSSVISTNEITIIIEPNAVVYRDGVVKVKVGYSILIVNKTDNPIYIDRANCFRRFNDLNTKSYFDNKQITVSHSNSTGAGLGIGIGPLGVGVGGSSSSASSETYGVDRFLVIGPRSKANLIDYNYTCSSLFKNFKIISDIEYWGFDLSSNEPVNQGEVKTYTEENSPYSNKYYITYSTDQNFNNIYTTEFELYAKYLVGAKIKESINMPSFSSAEVQLVKEYKKTIPDFWTDSLAIIGMPGQYTK